MSAWLRFTTCAFCFSVSRSPIGPRENHIDRTMASTTPNLRIQQTRTRTQLVATKSFAPDLRANLPQLEMALDVPGPALVPDIESDPTAPIAQLLEDAGFDMARHPEDEVTANTAACGPDLHHDPRHAIQAIGQQQRAFRQLREQAARQRQLGFAVARDRGGEGMVHADFEQDGHASFKPETRASPSTRRRVR